MGGDFDRRWRQIADAVAAMKTLWRDEVSEHEGPYVRFPQVRMYPKPAQRPHPPVLLGGGSPRIFDRIAAWGDGWIPGVMSPEEVREGKQQLFAAARAAGRDPEDLTVVAFGLPGALRTATEADELRALAVHHSTVWLQERGEAVFKEMDALARALES